MTVVFSDARKTDPPRISSTVFVMHLVLLTAVTVGCGSPGSREIKRNSELNTWLARTIRDEGIKNAIIVQQTLFPFHFVHDSQELNELGKLDLAVLIRHYRDYPGQLNVRRGNADEDLYDQRVKGVRRTLEKAGVRTEAVQISDALPGGRGISSEEAIRILESKGAGGFSDGTGMSAPSAASGVRAGVSGAGRGL